MDEPVRVRLPLSARIRMILHELVQTRVILDVFAIVDAPRFRIE
jgi:hypothetical protein